MSRLSLYLLGPPRVEQRGVRCHAHHRRQDKLCTPCLEALSKAVALYRDGFLAGFSLRDSPGSDDWQRMQSEAMRREAVGTVSKLVRGQIDDALVRVIPSQLPATQPSGRYGAWSIVLYAGPAKQGEASVSHTWRIHGRQQRGYPGSLQL